MPDTLQFGLDILGSRDIAVRKMPEVELHARLKTPFQRHLVDGPGALAAIHGGMEVPGRVQMRPVVGGERYLLHRPALAIRQIFRLQPVEELQHPRQALLVIDILDGRVIARRIGRHVVLQGNGDIDQLARHGVSSLVFFLG